jgi:predicted SprT family Zn-dependent metalloprotease
MPAQGLAHAIMAAQMNHPVLGTLYSSLYGVGEWLLSEHFWNTPSMQMPHLTLEPGRVNEAGFYEPNSTLNAGPRINLNPYGNADGLRMGETLAHELVHHWEWVTGNPTTYNNHDGDFHQRMWALYGLKTDEKNGEHFGHDERWEEILQTMRDPYRLDQFKLPRKAPRRMVKHRCPGCGDSFHSRTMKSVKCLVCDIEYEVQ